MAQLGFENILKIYKSTEPTHTGGERWVEPRAENVFEPSKNLDSKYLVRNNTCKLLECHLAKGLKMYAINAD